MDYSSGMKFSTKDVDNDVSDGMNCAQTYHGAWWFRKCYDAHLNGEYLGGSHDRPACGIAWLQFKGGKYSYKIAEMKVGPGFK